MYVKRTHFTICRQYTMRKQVKSIYERYIIHETLQHKHYRYNTKCTKINTDSESRNCSWIKWTEFEEAQLVVKSQLTLKTQTNFRHFLLTLIVFTALHRMQTRSTDENSVWLSVCLTFWQASDKRVDCDKTKKNVSRFLYHTRKII